jgi:hypothetical protein
LARSKGGLLNVENVNAPVEIEAENIANNNNVANNPKVI